MSACGPLLFRTWIRYTVSTMAQFDEEKPERQLEELRKAEEEQLVEVLAASKYKLPYVDLSRLGVDNEALRIIPESEAREWRVAPFKLSGKNIFIAVRTPDPDIISRLKDAAERKTLVPTFYMASMASLEKVWDRYKEISLAGEHESGRPRYQRRSAQGNGQGHPQDAGHRGSHQGLARLRRAQDLPHARDHPCRRHRHQGFRHPHRAGKGPDPPAPAPRRCAPGRDVLRRPSLPPAQFPHQAPLRHEDHLERGPGTAASASWKTPKRSASAPRSSRAPTAKPSSCEYWTRSPSR